VEVGEGRGVREGEGGSGMRGGRRVVVNVGGGRGGDERQGKRKGRRGERRGGRLGE